ncbi:MAG: hypothetical protein ACRDT6_20065 [Micromonosporaceae bacterium]
MTRGRRPSPRPGRPGLPREIIAVLIRTAEETMRRHAALPDGRCSYCSQTWLHTDIAHPCPPYRIAAEFHALAGPESSDR